MVDCPDSLHSGADLIVSLSVYIKPAAFQSLNSDQDDLPRSMFNEGSETLAEQILRERKGSLVHLFKVLNLRPKRGSTLSKRRNGDLDKNDLTKLTKHPSKSNSGKVTKTEIVGDGEEIEVEADGEELTENELDLIYKKYDSPASDTTHESDPPKSTTERQHPRRDGAIRDVFPEVERVSKAGSLVSLQ